MDTKKHNGWTNYATWRIALEMFDGYTVKNATREDCKQYVEQYLEDSTMGREPLLYIGGWANAFLADVNWQEIADHLNDEVTESECYGKDAMHIDEIIDSLCLLT